jgi:hypothetical protein
MDPPKEVRKMRLDKIATEVVGKLSAEQVFTLTALAILCVTLIEVVG